MCISCFLFIRVQVLLCIEMQTYVSTRYLGMLSGLVVSLALQAWQEQDQVAMIYCCNTCTDKNSLKLYAFVN